MVKEVRSSIVITFKIKFKSKLLTIEDIIKDGKRYDKEYKINSSLRQNDNRGK